MSKHNHVCDKCMGLRQNKKLEKIEKLERLEKSKQNNKNKIVKIRSKRNEKNERDDESRLKEAAIIVMTDEDDLASVGSGKVYFDKGIGNIKEKFVVSKDGSNVKFRYSGLYRVQFEGTVVSDDEVIILEFKRNPNFEEGKLGFVKFNCDRGKISEATMLPFHRGDTLELILSTSSDSPVVVGKSSRLLIVRVDDI